MSITGSILASVGGSIAGGAIASSGAQNAANTQAQAANQAAQLQYQSGQNALGFQQGVYRNQLQAGAPFLNTGIAAAVNLANQLGLPVTGNIPQLSVPGINGTSNVPAYGYQPSVPTGTNVKAAGFEGTPWGGVVAGGKLDRFLQDTYGPDWGSGASAQGQQALSMARQSPTGQQEAAAATGTQPLTSLISPTAGTAGSLVWNPPTAITAQNDPGYLERFKLMQDALERSAAARGGLISGGTAQDLGRFAQDYASNEFQNVFNRYASGWQNRYNSLANLAGMGEVAGGQLNQAGSQAGGNVGNIMMNTAGMVGSNINNAGAARGSGYVGSANAWSGAFGGMSNGITSALLLNQLLTPGGAINTPLQFPTSGALFDSIAG